MNTDNNFNSNEINWDCYYAIKPFRKDTRTKRQKIKSDIDMLFSNLRGFDSVSMYFDTWKQLFRHLIS